MKGFKDVISADIDRTFANIDEFCDLMMVDGKEMRVLLDSDELRERKGLPAKGEHLEGLYEAHVIAYIPVADYGKMPKIGKLMTIGAKQYIIVDCINEAGIYSFTLRRNRM